MGKVFGVGWAKSGTTTLGRCFEILGYRHCAGRLDLVDHLKARDLDPILEVAGGYDAFEDWPWLLLFRELDEAFPGSRFVLTGRDPDRWLRSFRNMLADPQRTRPEAVRRRRILYDLPFPEVTDAQVVERVQQHERDVRDWFAGRPDDLLIVDWERGDGWDELCTFLGEPVPDVKFPHANRGTYSRPS